jgi:serine/threonine-protein kinase RsbW
VDAAAVTRAIAAARRFAESAGLVAGDADRLVVVVEEWVANIVEHGGPQDGRLVVLRLERSGGVVRIRVSDAGMAFDPRAAPDEGPNLERGGGAGLALIRGWSKIEDYRRSRRRNRLVLRLRS